MQEPWPPTSGGSRTPVFVELADLSDLTGENEHRNGQEDHDEHADDDVVKDRSPALHAGLGEAASPDRRHVLDDVALAARGPRACFFASHWCTFPSAGEPPCSYQPEHPCAQCKASSVLRRRLLPTFLVLPSRISGGARDMPGIDVGHDLAVKVVGDE